MSNEYIVPHAEEHTELSNVNARIRGLVLKKDHGFVLLETSDGKPYENMQTVLQSLDKVDDPDRIHFNGSGFQLMSDTVQANIEKIKVVGGPYRGGGDYMKVCITVRDQFENIENKNGFMTMKQYKTLCIFVILKSGCDDLLEPGLSPWR
jgi:hypothetical protein